MFSRRLPSILSRTPLVARYTTNTSKGLAQDILEQKVSQTAGKSLKAKKPSKPKGSDKGWQIGLGVTAGLLTFTGGVFGYLVLTFLYNTGRPYDSEDKNQKEDESLLAAYKRRAEERVNSTIQYFSEPAWEQLLPDPLPAPYQRPYTLVINLDETLIHSTWDMEHGWRIAKRPGVDYFLAYLSQFYEIIVFTSQNSMNAMPILDKLDPYQYIMYRLYREATRYIDGDYVKDISRLNRDPSKVIIMDSNPKAYSLQPENAVAVKPWKGESGDNYLLSMIPFLESLVLMDIPDVRPVCQNYYGKDIPHEFQEWENQMKQQIRIQWEEQNQNKKKGLASLLGGGGHQEQGPVWYLEEQRKQLHQTFAQEHDAMQEAAKEQLKMIQEEQAKQVKDMKMTVWQLVTQGAPAPGQEGEAPASQQK
ncbi:NIF-domain-containing protein [Basidiobolus meristosporus CBS 931.73]|uniref:Mitochondrial import inner membrane translocase subunit TIM50 n=1 Tax=Basidiobolus meristosporus CBS 931.73 TaxID=1314790 RepID=A0A1Y1XB63_9FUNG|nr:NIF-domain-containing protein [Basidiobolus meristosporus CBS 931.73]|eukprot:ORX83011.1 NIF-domain-containing protein [Basidiobolus meristosporus CBS 931.73]